MMRMKKQKIKELSSPFFCPICGNSQVIHAEKLQEVHGIWCIKGCFAVMVRQPKRGRESLDIFNAVVDSIREEAKQNGGDMYKAGAEVSLKSL